MREGFRLYDPLSLRGWMGDDGILGVGAVSKALLKQPAVWVVLL